MKKNHLVGDALILTVSDQIEELDYLLESLPNICFHIAAPVQFSEKIRSLETNYNVRLRTITNEEQLNFLVDTCDFIGAGCLIRNDIPSNSVVYNNGNLVVKERR